MRARGSCLDNLLTGPLDNLAGLTRDPRLDLIEADVIDPLPRWPPHASLQSGLPRLAAALPGRPRPHPA